MGKGPFSFRRTSARRRLKRTPEAISPPRIGDAAASSPPQPTNNNNSLIAAAAAGGGGKGKKKTGGARLWMRFDRSGQSELVECDKNTIIRRASIPPRDLRILGPLFSHSSNILGKFAAMFLEPEF